MKLMTGNINYTIDDLAERLDISYRSVYRYIDTFKQAGFVVQKNGEVYRLGKESRYFKDISQLIHFTDEEAYIVNSLIDGLDDNNMLKQNLRRKLASVYNCTALADSLVKGKNAINIHAVIESIEQHRQIVLHNYASSHTGEIRDRRVEAFAFTTNYIQIWCYDLDDNSNKLFKSARIDSVELLETPWSATEQHRQGYMDIFRMSSYTLTEVKLELGVMAHNLILEEFPLSERDMVQTSADSWLLTTKVCDLHGVARFVTGLMHDIRIVDSPALEEFIADYSTKYLTNRAK